VNIYIDTDVLGQAAEAADGVAADVGLARQASGAALSNSAFGVMCSPLFVQPYTEFAQTADAAMASISQAVTNAANSLRNVANALSQANAESARAIQQIPVPGR